LSTTGLSPSGRFAALLVLIGACLILVPALGWGRSNFYVLGGVLCVVTGALGIAIGGEAPRDEHVRE